MMASSTLREADWWCFSRAQLAIPLPGDTESDLMRDGFASPEQQNAPMVFTDGGVLCFCDLG